MATPYTGQRMPKTPTVAWGLMFPITKSDFIAKAFLEAFEAIRDDKADDFIPWLLAQHKRYHRTAGVMARDSLGKAKDLQEWLKARIGDGFPEDQANLKHLLKIHQMLWLQRLIRAQLKSGKKRSSQKFKKFKE